MVLRLALRADVGRHSPQQLLQRGTRDTPNSMGPERRRSRGQTQTNTSHTRYTHTRQALDPTTQVSQGDRLTGNRGQPAGRGTREAVQRGPAAHQSDGVQAGPAKGRGAAAQGEAELLQRPRELAKYEFTERDWLAVQLCVSPCLAPLLRRRCAADSCLPLLAPRCGLLWVVVGC
jgi:hypothetical protein